MQALGLLSETAALNLAHAYFRAGKKTQARVAYSALTTAPLPWERATALNQLALLAFHDDNLARALDLLRRALRADPGAAIARANYEALLRYQATNPAQRQPLPRLGKRPTPKPGQTPRNQPGGARPEGSQQAPASTAGSRQPNNQRAAAAGQRQQQQQVGSRPGGEARGQSPEADPHRVAPGSRRGSGAETADNQTSAQTLRVAASATADLPLDQARMLLDAMRAAEEQYLQQRRLPAAPTPHDPSRPDW